MTQKRKQKPIMSKLTISIISTWRDLNFKKEETNKRAEKKKPVC